MRPPNLTKGRMVTVWGVPLSETPKIRRLTHSGSLLVRNLQVYSRATSACTDSARISRAVRGQSKE
jgi:hypothetical protein